MQDENIFPLAGIVGQEKAKQALCIVAVNRKAGGLLVVGEKGSGKSTLVRGLAQLLIDCRLLTVPLNITDDMVFGSLDMEYAIRAGEKKFLPGILGRANGNILYIDEVNLLRADLLQAIVEVALQGDQLVEREGLSCLQASEYSIIGTMDPEEGPLPVQLLDKFGMSVAMEPEKDGGHRVQIIRHVLAYEADGRAFRKQYHAETEALRKKIAKGRDYIGRVETSAAMIRLAAVYCAKANCAGNRADIFLLEAARAIAALAERFYVLPQDVETAAEFVLAHRLRENSPCSDQSPAQDEATDQEKQSSKNSDDPDFGEESQADLPLNSDGFASTEVPGESKDVTKEGEASPEDTTMPPEDAANKPKQQAEIPDTVTDVDTFLNALQMKVDALRTKKDPQGYGKRNLTKTKAKQGRYVRARLPGGKICDLAFDATLRAAAPYQKFRKKSTCVMNIRSEDLREKQREKRMGNTFLFLVDASGSMGAKMRMKAVKETILSLLNDAYQKRDQVGMIAFRRDKAEIILPITRSIDLAHKCLQEMPTGGKTPLAEGLSTAFSVVQKAQRAGNSLTPILIFLTDGRLNGSAQGDSVAETIHLAEKFCQAHIQSVVIDTETDFIKLGIAKKIAQAMQAMYYPLEELSKQNLLHIVRQCS